MLNDVWKSLTFTSHFCSSLSDIKSIESVYTYSIRLFLVIFGHGILNSFLWLALKECSRKKIINFCVNKRDKLLCFYTNVAFENIGFRAIFWAFSFAWTRPYVLRAISYNNVILFYTPTFRVEHTHSKAIHLLGSSIQC